MTKAGEHFPRSQERDVDTLRVSSLHGVGENFIFVVDDPPSRSQSDNFLAAIGRIDLTKVTSLIQMRTVRSLLRVP
jgi:hypothetical protein